MAAIAAVTIAVPLFSGGLRPALAVPALVILAVAAWYFSRLQASNDSAASGNALPIPQDDHFLADVIGALPDPTILLDTDGRVVTLNAMASTIAPSLRPGELAMLALRIPEVVDAVRRAGVSRRPERAEFAERVPSERWFEVIVTPMPDEDGHAGRSTQRLLLTFRDLSPIRRVEEMRVDFVANASHELRTPLAALSGFIETLKGPARNDTAARERFLDIMEAQAKRMARLIDDLLSLSRIELSAHVRPQTPVELLPIIRQVVDALQMLARDRGVTVTVSAPKEPLVVSGDRDELTRVFENLIENALKYGASGKRVEITLSRAFNVSGGEEAVAAVRDYGPGISGEHLPRLTERFYRVDVTESRAQGGTGLGLALVKHIMNRHRGRLNIESRSGEGATFTVRLPMSTGLMPATRKNS
ncbi:ATP-binding protein [Pseudorhodoplanes sinuspersici]|nr:ATP-binding protein [Pseudorhodoplanes sinuspersici]